MLKWGNMTLMARLVVILVLVALGGLAWSLTQGAPEAVWVTGCAGGLAVVLALVVLVTGRSKGGASTEVASDDGAPSPWDQPSEAAASAPRKVSAGSARSELRTRWSAVERLLRDYGTKPDELSRFMFLGAAASGKTMSIRMSGQEFPIGDKPLGEAGGEAGCSWFLTNQAMLIDPPGRYIEGLVGRGGEAPAAGERAEWDALLDLLGEVRPRGPLNGVVLTVSCEDLVDASPARREHLAEALRVALLDIEQRLDVRLPVTLLVTKMDLLPGFLEFAGQLEGNATRSLLGWSRSGPRHDDLDVDEFHEGHVRLCQRLDGLSVGFLEAVSSPEDPTTIDWGPMDRMLAFPSEFRALGDPVGELLSRVFAPNRFGEQHAFRGVYFWGGGADGELLGGRGGELVQGLGTPTPAHVGTTGTSRPYFLADVFSHKLFAEDGLVSPTRRLRNRSRRKGLLAAAASLVLGGLGYWHLSSGSDGEAYTTADLAGLIDTDVGSRLPDRTFLDGYDRLAAQVAAGAGGSGLMGLLGGSSGGGAELAGATHKLWAEKIFAPMVLNGFVPSLDEAGAPSDLDELADLGGLFITLRGMGLDEAELDQQVLRGEILAGVKASWPAAASGDAGWPEAAPGRVDDALARLDEEGDDVLEPLVALTGSQAWAARLDATLGQGLVTFLAGWLDDPAGPGAPGRPRHEGLADLYDWHVVWALDRGATEDVARLTQAVEDLRSVDADDGEARDRAMAAGEAALGRLHKAHEKLAAHLARSDQLAVLDGSMASLVLPGALEKQHDLPPAADLAERMDAVRKTLSGHEVSMAAWAENPDSQTLVRTTPISGEGITGAVDDALGELTERLGPYRLDLPAERWAAILSLGEKLGDVSPPELSIPPEAVAGLLPVAGATDRYRTTRDSVQLQVRVNEPLEGPLMVGSTEMVDQGGGLWEGPVVLAAGSNSLALVATDRNGNRAERTITVLRDQSGPVVAGWTLDGERPTEVVGGTRSRVAVELGEPAVRVAFGGTDLTVAADGLSAVGDVILAEEVGPWAALLEATDDLGNTTAETVELTVSFPWHDARGSLADRFYVAEKQTLEDDGLVFPRSIVHRATGLRLVYVSSGEFEFGLGDDPYNSPLMQRAPEIRAVEGFYIGETEVTWGAWIDGGERTSQTQLELPVNNIPYSKMQEWLASNQLRIPSEVEWEYAASGPEDLLYPWGNEYRETACNRSGAVKEVGSTGEPNWCGTYDMVGNVSEFCLDTHPMTGERILRGGNYADTDPKWLSNHSRDDFPSNRGSPRYGFRVAVSR